jgi:hypothetical protein
MAKKRSASIVPFAQGAVENLRFGLFAADFPLRRFRFPLRAFSGMRQRRFLS